MLVFSFSAHTLWTADSRREEHRGGGIESAPRVAVLGMVLAVCLSGKGRGFTLEISV